ncbi:hypothetical protein RZR38_11510 [Citrobacter freundii]|uniref:hypothetical protein n=1 Tax=Citrobacter freundii TaxID=546 RepID=UPI00292ACE53|nr:hypothetical protein [Citrobacter freundii]MDV1856386.1 hypothetical protein [Citrobacter freundii]MEB0417580.1 hypothetical protein [Citrobacter freundii]
MKFNELSSESRSQAKIALGQLIVARREEGVAGCENLGRCVAAAFIAMERHDGAPEVKIGDNVEDGRSGTGIKIGDSLPIKQAFGDQ